MKGRLVHKLGYAIVVGLSVEMLVAGCGGDDDPEALSKEEFISQADRICAAGAKNVTRRADHIFSEGELTEAQLERFASETVVPESQSQIDQLRALPEPDGDADTVSAFLDTAQEGIDEIERDPSTLQGSGGETLDRASRLATDYGLTECG